MSMSSLMTSDFWAIDGMLTDMVPPRRVGAKLHKLPYEGHAPAIHDAPSAAT